MTLRYSREEILKMIPASGVITMSELKARTGFTGSQLSPHLRNLKRANLIEEIKCFAENGYRQKVQ